MAKQIACLLTNFLTVDGYSPRFSGALQPDEHWSYNLVDLLSTVSQYEPLLPDSALVDKHGVPQGWALPKLGLVYVYAENTRLDDAHASPHYHVFWRYTIVRGDPIASLDLLPTMNPVLAEVQAIRDYLALQTNKTGAQVTTWFKNKFNVATNNDAITWATSHTRAEFIAKMAQAFERWNDTQLELNAV